MNQVIVALEVVCPVFLIIGLGAFLKYKKIMTEDFIKIAMKIIFMICLPGSLFLKVSKADISSILSGDSLRFALFVFVSTLIIFFISRTIAKFMVPKKSRGAFVQGSFRSNYIIIGYSVLYSLLGDAIISRMALMVIVIVPLYNILSIWVLSEDDDQSMLDNIKNAIKKVVTNPLIIGIVLGFIVAVLKIEMPIILESTISKLGATGTPLGLLGIGGYLSLDSLKSVKLSSVSVILKVIVYPILVTTMAYLLGYGYMDAVIIFIIFGSPAAISSFIMASALNGDSQMAANIVIISTALSLFTFIAGLSSIAYLYQI